MFRLSKAGMLGILTGVVGLLVSLLPFGFELEENVGLQILFKLRGTRQAPSDVVIVSIDNASAVHLNLPVDLKKWSRSLHARLTDNLAQAGAAVIAFDIMFDEARLDADDAAFAEAIRRARNVTLFESLRRETVSTIDQQGPLAGTVHSESLIPPIPPLAHAAVALAPFPLPKVPVKVSQYWTFKTSAGDTPTLPIVVFQLFALKVYDAFIHSVEKVHPSLAEKLPRNKEALLTTMTVGKFIRVLRDFFAKAPHAAEKLRTELQRSSILPVGATEQRILTSLINMYHSGNSQYLNFYGPPGTITTIPYHQVLQLQTPSVGNATPLDVHGKAVFVGFSERFRPDQKDGFYTVFSQESGMDISGVEIAATAFANLLEDMPVRPLGWHEHLGTMLLWGILLGVLCRLLSPVTAAVSASGLGVLYLLAAQYQFTTAGKWYPLIVPVVLQIPLAFFGAVLWKYVDTNREQRNIREAFGYYLPDRVIDQLAESIANIKTSGQMVYGICLFTDAGAYTSLAETMHPKELGSFMNTYYAAVFEPVRQHSGIVSDVIGDAMLAIWAAAQPDVALREQACRAALDVARAVEQFKRTAGTVHLPTRIGLHAGFMLLGNIGALHHYEYRAVGDIVNTASRIEGLNKLLGTQTLVSEEMLQQLDGFLTRELGTFLLAGKSQPLVVHELQCRMEESTGQQRHLYGLFAEALETYRRQAWDKAIKQFSAIISSPGSKDDGPSLFYVQLCEQYKANPPGAAWDGVVRMGRK